MSLSNVPAIEFTPAGVVIPTESEILTGVQADYNQAFGGGLNPALETPQGQMASSEAAIIGDKNNEFLYYVNQIDPQYSSGRFQDAIGRIYFLTRKPGAPTVVLCTVNGLAGTVIPSGTLAQDSSGNFYVCTNTVTIPDGGTLTNVQFENSEDGPIACPANTLTQVYQAIPGWDTLNNPLDGILGSNVESRAEFEFRRKNSVAANSHGSLPAIYAAVFSIPDVLDVYVTENVTNLPVNVGETAYTLSPHSLYVAVVGGDNGAIAEAIWSKKDVGCDYNGNTTVLITDNNYSYPQPTYDVTFERPSPVPVLFAVSIVNDPSLPADIIDRVKAAIIARFNGADDTQRERIGSTVFAGRYYAAIAATSPIISIISVYVGTVTATLLQVPIGVDQQPTISESNISVTLV